MLLKGTYVGSLAKFKNKHTFSIEPFSSKSCLKNLAASMFTYNIQCTMCIACSDYFSWFLITMVGSIKLKQKIKSPLYFMHMNKQFIFLTSIFFITCVAKNLHPWQQTQWQSYLHGRPAHSSLEVWPDLPVYKSGRQSEGRVHMKRSVISKFKYKHRKIVINVLYAGKY